VSEVLAIVGPTASGKSRLALTVARQRTAAGRPTELIAVDAFTIYRGMDIATATPSAAERVEVPHHLVDVLDPWEELTVAAFQRRARDAIADVRERGATPLLVGGSGLYWRAVVDDLRFPPTDPTVRTALEDRWRDREHAAHAHLASFDPAAAERIDPANLRRTVRALEVIELTGRRFSHDDGGWRRFDSVVGTLTVAYLEPETERLRERITTRAAAMVAGGLLDEARALRALPQALSRTAAQAIGYAEAFAVLDGELPIDRLAIAIARRTWRYARRQRAWFRADPRCEPIDPVAAHRRLAGG
jgi:tRNA dimethylallyltransferase